MPLPKIIAFVGPIGAGKTTAANTLCHALHYRKVSFADPLKRMLMEMGCTSEDVYGESKEKQSILLCGRTPRYAMQTLGTEWGRTLIHPDLWTRVWEFEANKHPLVVCDDARFPNEFGLIKLMGGIMVKITRPDVEYNKSHESEAYEPTHDFLLHNSGTITKFRTDVLSTIKDLETV